MKRALITGALGFVGGYMRRELEDAGYEVTGADIVPGKDAVCADLCDAETADRLIAEVRPDVLIHLAGQADVGASWKIPQKTVQINVIAAVNLMEAVRKHCPACRMVLVGSADEYGRLGERGVNVTEDLELAPASPYAVSKKAQEDMAAVYVKAYGLQICCTRSFNHSGAGQREGFLIPDFSAGIARVERGIAPSVKVGNLDSRRDFTHVKDVVRAYRLLAECGRAGEVYNVGSGEDRSAREILERLTAMAACPVTIESDPARMRPSDTPVIRCCRDKLTRDTGWEPEHTLDEILSDVLNDYRKRIH